MKTCLLLLLIPAAIVAIAVILVAVMGSRALALVAGPVNIFNAPWHAPSATEIAGYYRLSKETNRPPEGNKLPRNAGIRLGKDHVLEITDVPSFGDFGAQPKCNYNGTGKWGFGGEGVKLYLNIDASTRSQPGDLPSCAPAGLYGVFDVLGHSRPYRIWYWIGDPDSEQGLTFELQNP
jgi:hypothetical protein